MSIGNYQWLLTAGGPCYLHHKENSAEDTGSKLQIIRNLLHLWALRYELEGCGFDSRWCHWNFSL